MGIEEDRRITERRVTAEPPPTDGTGPAIWDLVLVDFEWYRDLMSEKKLHLIDKMIQDCKSRDEFGTKKYGKRLRVGDGRTNLNDAYQEGLDLVVYLRKEIEIQKINPSNSSSPIVAMYHRALGFCFDLRSFIYDRDEK